MDRTVKRVVAIVGIVMTLDWFIRQEGSLISQLISAIS
jgi:hypothetical protein